MAHGSRLTEQLAIVNSVLAQGILSWHAVLLVLTSATGSYFSAPRCRLRQRIIRNGSVPVLHFLVTIGLETAYNNVYIFI